MFASLFQHQLLYEVGMLEVSEVDRSKNSKQSPSHGGITVKNYLEQLREDSIRSDSLSAR